ncbi:MAG: hypothetical protein N4A57_00725 [Anaeromicrobium sp.]|jgi:hypothetical protein|nr:hypothetical protein [Anaeromicrobium sp.]MCT4592788.1 hypothetical protein [Anaeromicrobium sp.]
MKRLEMKCRNEMEKTSSNEPTVEEVRAAMDAAIERRHLRRKREK